jgi:hypothetical protein
MTMDEDVRMEQALPSEEERGMTQQIVYGLVVPFSIFCTIFCVIQLKTKRSSRRDAMFTNKARQLMVVIATAGSLIVTVNATGAAILVWVVAENHPTWAMESNVLHAEQQNNKDLLSGPGLIVGTAPQVMLDDLQFAVYTGFITWITCLVAGLGLEIFVWYHFLQVSARLEIGHIRLGDEKGALTTFSSYFHPRCGVKQEKDFGALPSSSSPYFW